MTQSLVTPWVFAVGDGLSVSFPYPWRIGSGSDLEVYLEGILTTAYTLTGIDAASGGTVVFFTPPPSGQIVFLRRATPQTQLTDYVSNDPFDAAAHEAALDKLTRLVQDQYERIVRAPSFAVDAPNVLRNLVFPGPEPLKLIGWSGSGTELTLFDPAIVQVTVDASTGEAHGISTATVASVGGAESLTAAALIPAGCELVGVGYRVVTALSTENSLASVDLGGMGLVDRWGTDLGITLDSVNNAGHWKGGRAFISTAQDVVVLPKPAGALFGTVGAVKLSVFFTTWTPLA